MGVWDQSCVGTPLGFWLKIVSGKPRPHVCPYDLLMPSPTPEPTPTPAGFQHPTVSRLANSGGDGERRKSRGGREDESGGLEFEHRDSKHDLSEVIAQTPRPSKLSSSIQSVFGGMISEADSETSAPHYFQGRGTSIATKYEDQAVWLYDDIDDQELKRMKEDSVPSHSFIIDPRCRFRLIWDSAGLLLIVIDAFMITFELSFVTESEQDDLPASWTFISIFATAFFGMDVCLNFITGYMINSRLGYATMRLNRIVSMYGRSWFLVDIIATIPWYTILDAATGGTGDAGASKVLRAGRFNKTIRILRFVRMLRLLKLMRGCFQTKRTIWSALHGWPMVKHVLSLGGYLFGFLALCHVNSCLFHLLAPDFISEDDPLLSRFADAYFWAWIHLLAVAPVDVPAHREVRFLSMVVSLQSMLLLGYIISRITRKAEEMSDESRRRIEDIERASEFMHSMKVDQFLQQKIHRFLNLRSRAGIADMRGMLGSDSVLYEQLCGSIYLPRLVTFPFFSWLDTKHAHGPLLMRKLATEVSIRAWAPHEIIFKKGDPANAFYMVIKGALRVTRVCRCPAPSQECVCDFDLVFRSGTWLGEKCLFFEDTHRFNTARSMVSTEALVLASETFRAICVELEMKERVDHYIEMMNTTGVSPGCPFCGETSHWGNACELAEYRTRKTDNPLIRRQMALEREQDSVAVPAAAPLFFNRS